MTQAARWRDGFRLRCIAVALICGGVALAGGSPHGSVAYVLDGGAYLLEAREGASPVDVAAAVGADEAQIALSPDGAWLLLNLGEELAGCDPGGPCLVLAPTAAPDAYEPVPLQQWPDRAVVASGGHMIVFSDGGPHPQDLWAVFGAGERWSEPRLLTADSPFAWNDMPSLSRDGRRILFDCGDEPYGAAGTAICEVRSDGSGFRIVVEPGDGPPGSDPDAALHHPAYAPDGGVVFEADWDGGNERIWRLPAEGGDPARVTERFGNDNSPCVLPDGRIASLWLSRDGNARGAHELKLMAPDGQRFTIPLPERDVADVGVSCGGALPTVRGAPAGEGPEAAGADGGRDAAAADRAAEETAPQAADDEDASDRAASEPLPPPAAAPVDLEALGLDLSPSACPPNDARRRFHVAPEGDDDGGDGSEGAPWATLPHALRQVPDGVVVVVAPGVYEGRTRLTGRFDRGVLACSREPYRAVLRSSDETTVTAYGWDGPVHGITLQGFEITHAGPGAGPLVVHIDGAGQGNVYDLVLRDNVIHDSFDNDLLKINDLARDVLVEANLFYNQAGSDEHIDVNGVEAVTIQDNVFMNDFEGSGRTNPGDTSSFIVIKDSNGDEDGLVGSRAVIVRRNAFLSWQGSPGANFVLIGEDGAPYFEADGVQVENNLLLGNGGDVMRAPFGVKGGRDVLFLHNTVLGDLPSQAFGMRLNVEGANVPNEEIRFHHNVWADPTGTMGAAEAGDRSDFADTPPGETRSVELLGNLYWNAGLDLPQDAAELVDPSDDPAAVTGDPRLPDPAGLTAPRWLPQDAAFADGSRSVREVWARLLITYGMPREGSAAVDAADPERAAGQDGLGRPRGEAPDLGAIER